MPEFQDSATTRIAAKPDEVFKLITDIDRLPEWNAVIEKVVSKPPTLMPGAEWVVTLHVPGMPRWDSRSQVVEFDRDARRFVYRSQTDDGNPSYALWAWDVRPAEEGAHVTLNWDAHPRTFWRKVLFSRIRRRQLAKEAPASLRALAAVFAPVTSSG